MRQSELLVAAPPLSGALEARDLHLGRRMGNGLTASNALAEKPSTPVGERRATVRHEDLRMVVLAWAPALLQPEIFAFVEPGASTTSLGPPGGFVGKYTQGFHPVLTGSVCNYGASM